MRIRNWRGGSAFREDDPIFTADLIVDALGRRSQTPEWLVEMGYPAPKESEVDSFLGYVTRKYKRKPGTPMLLLGANAPSDPYAGLLFPEEDDTMVATIAGYNKQYPPTDPDEFDAFVHVLGLTSGRPSGEPSQFPSRMGIAAHPAAGVIMRSWSAGPSAMWGWAMPSAASTRSMDSAIRAWYFDAGDEARLSEKTTEKIRKANQGSIKISARNGSIPGYSLKFTR